MVKKVSSLNPNKTAVFYVVDPVKDLKSDGQYYAQMSVYPRQQKWNPDRHEWDYVALPFGHPLEGLYVSCQGNDTYPGSACLFCVGFNKPTNAGDAARYLRVLKKCERTREKFYMQYGSTAAASFGVFVALVAEACGIANIAVPARFLVPTYMWCTVPGNAVERINEIISGWFEPVRR